MGGTSVKILLRSTTFSILILYSIFSQAKGNISNDSILLAKCESVYAYTAQLLQMRNNIGGAINVLRRASIVSAANFMLNAEEETIAGWKIGEFVRIREAIVDRLRSGDADPFVEGTRCDKEAIPIALKLSRSDTTLWGKTYNELQMEAFKKLRESLGL